jgi:hypothetical protein
METKVTLVEWPRHPIQTVWYLWEAARTNDPMPPMHGVVARCKEDPEFNKRVRETFEKVVDSAIPIAENLQFVFLLEGISISLREQLVRHKVGMKVGERLGVDMFPDLHDSTWWAQSTRAMDMGKFYDDGMFRIPESIKKSGKDAMDDYLALMANIQGTYKTLLDKGVPGEDAREVLPLATQHRISWGLNLSAIMHVTKKRSCWIMQLGVWEPIIKGMISELVTKVDPYFSSLVTPPCMKKDTFNDCLYHLDNERRMDRKDPLLPCPLYIAHHSPTRDETQVLQKDAELKSFYESESDYRHFWMRDTRTGQRLIK